MKVKILKTIVYCGNICKIGSETDLPEEAVKAFGGEYVEVLEQAEPEKVEPSETTEPETKPEDEEQAAPEKVERKKSKKK